MKNLHKTVYYKLYYNNGILVFKKLISVKEIKDCLDKFQKAVNKLLQSDKLKFTMMMWKPSPTSKKSILWKVEVRYRYKY